MIPEEVLPGQVAMVLLVQTREPCIQTLDLTNLTKSGLESKLKSWVLNARFPEITVLKEFWLSVTFFGLCGDEDNFGG